MEETFTLPILHKEQIDHCSFGFWYALFKKHTFASMVITLDQTHPFVLYLLQDGLYVHQDRPEYQILAELNEGNSGSQIPEDESEVLAPTFPELEEHIKQIIEEYDGAVFPKLNWSSPKDATWISTTGTLKCQTPSEIFLLLKASDFVTHDLHNAYDQCAGSENEKPSKYDLVLRKWYDLSPSLEFRCFVKSKCLRAISQRDCENFYDFLLDVRDRIKEMIVQFFYTVIVDHFPESDFIFDVYVSKKYDRVWLIDFSPFGTITEPLMFEWEELCLATIPQEIQEIIQNKEYEQNIQRLLGIAEMRLVELQAGIRANSTQFNRFPQDVFNISTAEGIEAFVSAFRQGQLEDDDASSSEGGS